MARLSKAAKEPASRWIQRIQAAQRVWSRLRDKRVAYRDALEFKFPMLVPPPDPMTGVGMPQIDVNVSRRYCDRLQSMSLDDFPVIKYPRDADGDEVTAGMAERLIQRVVGEIGMPREYRAAISDVCWAGSSDIWFGFHADVVSRKQALAAATSAGEMVQEALQGQHEAGEGQDHALAAKTMQDAALDPVNAVSLPDNAFAGLLQGAEEHLAAAEDEAKGPREIRVKNREVWVRRLPVGTWSVYDPTVWDIRDARWAARKLVYGLEDVRRNPAFNPRVRNKVEATALTHEDGVEPIDSVDGLGNEEYDRENGRVVVWEVWDRRWGTRHYVTDGLDEYLESDESNPYVDPKTGEDLIPDFFPMIHIAPNLAASEKAERVYGLPLLEAGWPQQQELVVLRSYALSAVKRTVRVYITREQDEDRLRILASGQDGLILRPGDSYPADRPLRDYLEPVQFTGPHPEIYRQAEKALYEWAMAMGFPVSELTTQPVADTATQEELGIASGRAQTADVIRQVEQAFAQGCEIVRAFIRAFYTDEEVAELLGPGAVDKWNLWRDSSLEGDKLDVRFAGQAKQESAVRLKQKMDAYSLLQQQVGAFGLPKWDTSDLLEDICRDLGVGKPKPYQPSQQELASIAMSMAGMGPGGGQPQGAPPQKPQGSDQPTGERQRGQLDQGQDKLNATANRLPR